MQKHQMAKVITMVLYNRPDYTRQTLEALRQCDGVNEYTILVHVEPGEREVLSLAKGIDFTRDLDVVLNPQRLGIGRNTFAAWEHGFEKSDFVIHIEDDTVPARDCLRYMEYCNRKYRDDPEIFSVASYNFSNCLPSQRYHLSRRRYYTCWLIGLWRDRWLRFKNHWSPDPERYASHLNAELDKFELMEVFPLLSRSQNIGAERGIHVPSAEWHRENQHTEYWAGNLDLPPGKYREVKGS